MIEANITYWLHSYIFFLTFRSSMLVLTRETAHLFHTILSQPNVLICLSIGEHSVLLAIQINDTSIKKLIAGKLDVGIDDNANNVVLEVKGNGGQRRIAKEEANGNVCLHDFFLFFDIANSRFVELSSRESDKLESIICLYKPSARFSKLFEISWKLVVRVGEK